MYTIYIYFRHVAGQLFYSNNRETYRKATWIGQLVWTVAINSFTNVPNDWNTADLVARWHVMTVNFTECRIQALKLNPPQPPGATGSIWEGRRRACEVEGWEVEDPSCLVAKLWRISWPTIPNPHHLREMNGTETFKQKVRCTSVIVRWGEFFVCKV